MIHNNETGLSVIVGITSDAGSAASRKFWLSIMWVRCTVLCTGSPSTRPSSRRRTLRTGMPSTLQSSTRRMPWTRKFAVLMYPNFLGLDFWGSDNYEIGLSHIFIKHILMYSNKQVFFDTNANFYHFDNARKEKTIRDLLYIVSFGLYRHVWTREMMRNYLSFHFISCFYIKFIISGLKI